MPGIAAIALTLLDRNEAFGFAGANEEAQRGNCLGQKADGEDGNVGISRATLKLRPERNKLNH